ncbi:MAG TPA: cell wall hydrolase [Rhizomicrobium sp.]
MKNAVARSDRALILALSIVLATASAAVGSAMTYHPFQALARPAVTVLTAPVAPPQIDLDVPAADLLAEHRCLTEALYYEARGEGKGGEQAVAEVIFHRLSTGRFGHSICAVVYEGAFHPGCQFSFTCDGSMHHLHEETAWNAAEELASRILIGAVRLGNVTGSAINYHATTVNPYWAPTLKKTTQIGNHIFYRNAPHKSGVTVPSAGETLIADASRPDAAP